MNRALAMLIIGLVFGGGLGFVLAAANNVTLDGHDQSVDHAPEVHSSTEMAAHDHEEIVSIPLGADAPTLDARLEADPVSGWNLELVTSGFVFAPEKAGLDHIEGEGHGHLYINGVKIARLYGAWYHIGELPAGDVDITVTLNANDHRVLAVGDVPVEATITVRN